MHYKIADKIARARALMASGASTMREAAAASGLHSPATADMEAGVVSVAATEQVVVAAAKPTRHFQQVFQELRDTEHAHIGKLTMLKRLYADEMARLLPGKVCDRLFGPPGSNVGQLQQLAIELQIELSKQGDAAEVWGRAFIEVIPFYRMYTSYIRTYASCLAELERV